MRAVSLVLLVSVLSAGCVTESGGWRVSGTFMEDATDADVADLRERIQPHGGQMVVMESYPMQFQITTPDASSCEEVRAVLGSAGYVDFYGECASVDSTGDSNEPTGSPAY